MANTLKYSKKIIQNFLHSYNASLIDENNYNVCDGCFIYSSDGYILRITDKNIRENKMPERLFTNPQYVIYNIRNYLINHNIRVELLSDQYVNSTSKLKWKCECGNIYDKSLRQSLVNGFFCTSCLIHKNNTVSYNNASELFQKYNCRLVSEGGFRHTDEIKYICNIHHDKGIQTTTYSRFRDGNHCRYCHYEKISKLKQIPEEEIKHLTESKGFIYYSKTTNKKTKIQYICPKHKEKGIQEKTLADMKKTSGRCPYCLNQHKTHLDFVEEMQKKFSHISVLGQYQNAKTKINLFCNLHDYQWSTTPNAVLKTKYGCPKCGSEQSAIAKTKSDTQFVDELNQLTKNITLLSSYQGATSPIRCQCKIHGTVWLSTPSTLLNHPNSCPDCVNSRMRDHFAKTQEAFVEELKCVNPNITVIGEYVNTNTKIKCRCEKHNYVWDALPSKLLNRNAGCPKCTRYSGEQILYRILDQMHYTYIPQHTFIDCKDKSTLPFDCFLPSENIAIEYDGEGHYEPINYMGDVEKSKEHFLKVKNHDQIKTQYCRDHNIKLIRIPYWEKNTMKNYLLSKL